MPDEPSSTPTTSTPTTSNPTSEAMVPSARLREATERATAAEAARATAEAALAAARTEGQRWQSERAAYRAGVTDPEGVEVALFLHGRLPAENRPELGAWLGGLTAATAPKAIAGYLPTRPGQAAAASSTTSAPAASPASSTPAAPAAASVPVPLPAATAGGTAASGGYDAAQIAAMTAEAQRTGNYEKLRAAMPQIVASAMGQRD